jgi:hypothetical protein
MKRLMMSAAALFALAAPALADDGSNLAGSVVRVTSGDQSFDATFAADGSYSDTNGVSGSWALGEQLCITAQTSEGAQVNCGPWNPDLAVGGSWTTPGWSDEGTTITVELISAG